MKNCSQLLKSIFFSLTISLMYAQHFNVEISPTGESTLFIFEDTVDILGTGVNSGDEFGLFDTNGIVDEDGNLGEVLVGSGTWNGSQLEIVTIMAVDLSDFGGPILPGAVSGNTMTLKVWSEQEQFEYDATYTTSSAGTGAKFKIHKCQRYAAWKVLYPSSPCGTI